MRSILVIALASLALIGIVCAIDYPKEYQLQLVQGVVVTWNEKCPFFIKIVWACCVRGWKIDILYSARASCVCVCVWKREGKQWSHSWCNRFVLCASPLFFTRTHTLSILISLSRLSLCLLILPHLSSLALNSSISLSYSLYLSSLSHAPKDFFFSRSLMHSHPLSSQLSLVMATEPQSTVFSDHSLSLSFFV